MNSIRIIADIKHYEQGFFESFPVIKRIFADVCLDSAEVNWVSSPLPDHYWAK